MYTVFIFFFFNDTATTEIYTLSLHDALPIFKLYLNGTEMPLETIVDQLYKDIIFYEKNEPALQIGGWWRGLDRKSTRLNSSHANISYAVFCLKKKKNNT